MNNQLPIHRQGIQQMLQLAYQHKDIQIPTLVLMNKLQIPLTETNAIQLERYENNANSITTQVQNLTTDLTTFLREMAEPYLQEEIPTTFSASSKKAATVAEQEALTNSPNTQQTNDHTANPFQSVAARIMSCIYDTALSASPISKTVLPDTTLQLTEPEQQELSLIHI